MNPEVDSQEAPRTREQLEEELEAARAKIRALEAQVATPDMTLSQGVILIAGPRNKNCFYSTTLYELHKRKMGTYAPVEPDTPSASFAGPSGHSTTSFPDDGSRSPEMQRLPTDHMVSFASLPTFMQPVSPREMVAVELCQALGQFVEDDFTHTLPKNKLGKMIIEAALLAAKAFESGPMLAKIQSPVYVFGDLHGNVEDLHYFYKQLVPFNDLSYCSTNFLFLGDYVDRGDYAVEVVAYLCAIKLLAPHRVTMLRGNHEDGAVNKDAVYGPTGFYAQLINNFGQELGAEVYNACTSMFRFLPLCATIDDKIFCVHGGLPRNKRVMELLANPKFPRLPTLFPDPSLPESAFDKECRVLAMDMCWSDPSEDDMLLDESGFGSSPRGQHIIVFGSPAVDEFMDRNKFQYIFRAHQEKADGLKISKNSRVLTIFSSSDYNGHLNGAGVVYVPQNHKIRIVVKDAQVPAEYY